MRALLSAVLMLSIGAAACSSNDGPVNTLTVMSNLPATPATQVTAVVDIRGQRIALSNEQLTQGRATGDQFVLPVGRTGVVRVQFTVTASPADTIGVADVSFTLVPGNNYSANLQRQAAKSGNTCFGCAGINKFPLRGSQSASSDSLWLYYANSPPLCKGCVL